MSLEDLLLKLARPRYGWSESKKLQTGRPVPATLQAKMKEAGIYTACFSIDTPNTAIILPPSGSAGIVPAGATPWPNVLAVLTWVTDGNRVQRAFTLGQGISISGTAEAVEVKVCDQTQPGLYAAEFEYTVNMLVTRGVRPGSHQQRPVLANPGPVIVGAIGTADVDIPKYLGASSVMVTVKSDETDVTSRPCCTEAIVSEMAGPNATATEIFSFFADPQGRFVPIMQGVNFLRITNRNGFQIECSVAFGIDG